MRTSLLFSLIAMAFFHAPVRAQHDPLPKVLGFQPESGPIKSDVAALLEDAPGLQRRMPFTAFVVALNQPPADEEEQPAQNPRVGNPPAEIQHLEPHAPKPSPYPATMPSVIAEPQVSFGFLIAGVVGWILLALGYVILVNRQPPAATKS